MRRRAFRPEPPGPLEDRSTPSGAAAAAAPAEPVVFSFRRLERVTAHIQYSFSFFTRFHQYSRLREELKSDVIPIPFARADGLAEVIDAVVDDLQDEFPSGSPRAVHRAQKEVIATMRVQLANRVRAGDVILR